MKENAKVSVKGGRYSGKKWFLKFPYKTIETDIDFFDEKVIFEQGSGFATVSCKYKTEIKYDEIYSVKVANKFSIPNTFCAVLFALFGFITEVYAVLIICLLLLWLGKTAVAKVTYSGGTYEIPTEFKSDAEEIKDKINVAINQ